MANLTLVIDDDVLRRARIRALEHGTSVNAVVREYINQFAGDSEASIGLADFVESARASTSGSGPRGRSWTRDDIHGERMSRYGL